jgi:hypothetical protein
MAAAPGLPPKSAQQRPTAQRAAGRAALPRGVEGIESRPEVRRRTFGPAHYPLLLKVVITCARSYYRTHSATLTGSRITYPAQRAPILRNSTKNVTVGIALFISLSLTPFGVAACQQLASLRTGESIRLTVVPQLHVIFGDTPGDASSSSKMVCRSNASGGSTCAIVPFRLKGKFLAVSPETITLRGSNGAQSVALSDVRLLEVKRRNAGTVMRSVVLGLIAGGVGGALIGSTRGPTNTGDGIITTPEKVVIGGILGGAAGVIGGTAYGVCCSGAWQPVPIARKP